MTYIVILNWKGANDTIACLKSVFQLEGSQFCVVVCDNASPDGSYEIIRQWLKENKFNFNYLAGRKLIELDRESSEEYIGDSGVDAIYLIQTGENLGYAGGNNVGIRLATHQRDMRFVWLLNNDTEVEPDSLLHLVRRCEENPRIGLCGSRLVYFHDRSLLQGLGGIYNPWIGTTKHYAALEGGGKQYDDTITESKIDYVIGASMLITRALLEKVGLLDESYFLYYEELDLAFRAKGVFSIGSASKSVVYHKEGASTGAGKSQLADFYSMRNRLLFTKKRNPNYYIFVRMSMVLVAINRFRKGRFMSALTALKLMVH